MPRDRAPFFGLSRDVVDTLCAFGAIVACLAGAFVALGGAAYAMEGARTGGAAGDAACELGRAICAAGAVWCFAGVGAVVVMARRGT
jgi:hypothetical protein